MTSRRRRCPSASQPAGLPLEQYAYLCAALRAHPERRDETLDAYGLTITTHRELEQAWRERLNTRPQLAQRFGALVEHYRAWMQCGSGD